jgi:hypothetical protein
MRRCLTMLSVVPALALFFWLFVGVRPEPSTEEQRSAPVRFEVLAAEPAAVEPIASGEARGAVLEAAEPALATAAPSRRTTLAARCERLAEIQAGVPASAAPPERGTHRGEYVIPGLDGGWGWSPPANWGVARVESLLVAADVPRFYGSLRLVDDAARIAPAGRHVLVRRDADGGFEFYELSADAQGRLHLQLVPQSALLDVLIGIGSEGARGLAAGEDAEIDWSGSRPGRPELRVRRRP